MRDPAAPDPGRADGVRFAGPDPPPHTANATVAPAATTAIPTSTVGCLWERSLLSISVRVGQNPGSRALIAPASGHATDATCGALRTRPRPRLRHRARPLRRMTSAPADLTAEPARFQPPGDEQPKRLLGRVAQSVEAGTPVPATPMPKAAIEGSVSAARRTTDEALGCTPMRVALTGEHSMDGVHASAKATVSRS